MVNGWNRTPEEVVEMGSVCEFKERLDNVWLTVFGEGSVTCGVEMVERKVSH